MSLSFLKRRSKAAPVQRPGKSRLVSRGGKFNVVRLGSGHSYWGDLYHQLFTISWGGFLALFFLLYIALNALFALAYWFDLSGIANAHPGSFVDAFFFSVQTMASIGYGALYPQSLYINIVVTIEAVVSLLWVAMATGLMFARFSRPTARVLFSQVAVITVNDGVPTLMFRAANQRDNQILEAQLRVTLVRNVVTPEGEYMRRFYELGLMRSQTPIFALTWTAFHPIIEDSPLYGLSAEDLDALEAEIVVTLTGIDNTFSQTIHARHSYIAAEIFWNMRFVDILNVLPDGRRAVDYRRFHDVMPLT